MKETERIKTASKVAMILDKHSNFLGKVNTLKASYEIVDTLMSDNK